MMHVASVFDMIFRQRLALLVSATVLVISHAAEPFPLGVRGLYADAYTTVRKAPTWSLNHPAVALLWGDEYLAPFGRNAETGRPAPRSGRYAGAAPVAWLLTPEPLAAQLGYKEDGGLRIDSITFDAARNQIRLAFTLYQSGDLRAAVDVAASATRDEAETLQRLQDALRLRLRLKGRITTVTGENAAKGINLHCAIDDATISASDLGVEVLSTRTATCTRPVAPSAHESAKALADAPPDALSLEEDGAHALWATTIELPVHAATDIPYAEGMQPFRRGWYLRDAFPPHKYDQPSTTGIIAVCEHTGLPATLTIPLSKPLPPGSYRVALSKIYLRARMFDTILHIQLGDETVETAYYFGGGGPWILAPAIRTGVVANEVRITAIQIGIGGRAEAPPYFRRFFATEMIRITGGKP